MLHVCRVCLASDVYVRAASVYGPLWDCPRLLTSLLFYVSVSAIIVWDVCLFVWLARSMHEWRGTKVVIVGIVLSSV